MSNYYLALGVDKDADVEKIKKAYRVCCKKYHPDHIEQPSPEDKKRFLHVQEAYETLSNAEKRESYDRRLSEGKGWTVPVGMKKSDISEMRDLRSAYSSYFRRFSSFLDDFFDGFIPGFFEEDTFYKKDLYLELILSPEEAAAGGEFPVDIPVVTDCPNCGGIGSRGAFVCLSCRGMGKVREKRSIGLHVPAGVRHGTRTRVSLENLGIKNHYLNIEILVERS